MSISVYLLYFMQLCCSALTYVCLRVFFQQEKKKEPEFSHFCDTCDRGFKTQDKYNEHIAQHIKVIQDISVLHKCEL